MKKIVMLIMIAAMTMQLAACSQMPKEETKEEKQVAETKEEMKNETKEEKEKNQMQNENKETITLTLAAAASLQYAFKEELIPLFEKENPSIKIEATYDSSGKLQQQIENGLQADVFFSASNKQMDALQGAGFVEESAKVNLLQNEVVLIVPSDSTLEMKEFKDVLLAKTIAIGDPESVPAGQYAKKAFDELGIFDQVKAVSSLGSNVTEVLNWVAEGSAQVGVVYASDAATTDKVKVISSAQKEGLIKPALYPVATLKETKYAEEANLFVAFLQSEKALEIFAKYGFTSAK